MTIDWEDSEQVSQLTNELLIDELEHEAWASDRCVGDDECRESRFIRQVIKEEMLRRMTGKKAETVNG